MPSSVIASQETASSPSATVGGVSILGVHEAPKRRAALYVDGFNFYHSIDELAQPHLKWTNLWALGERMISRSTETLVRACYFTAKKPGAHAKNVRHQEYMNALQHHGVKVVRGHFIEDEGSCRRCGHTWPNPKEKESDVNLALTILDDAYADLCDVAYVLTADSDHGATARFYKERFPKKEFVSVVPVGMEPSKATNASSTAALHRRLPA